MNASLFANVKNRANAINEAGGLAYRLPPKHALAQLAATGCFNGVYYSDAETQLATLLALLDQVEDNLYLAKLAVFARERAFMKDMPAALLLALSKRDTVLFHRVFDRVVDNGRVLRTLFQMLRSGLFGRKSLSYSLQRAFNRWLNGASVGTLLSASIGNDPSLRDVLRTARPTPRDNARRALFGWLTDKPIDKWMPATLADLPEEISALTAFRLAQSELEQVELLQRRRFRWDLLADSAKGPLVWKAIARQMGAQALRMNLNTLMRHGVFDDTEMVSFVAFRLSDEDDVRRSRQFPYQYLAAYVNAEERAAGSGAQLAGAGGRDRLRQRAGTFRADRDRRGRVGFDEFGGHGRPRPRGNEQGALCRRGRSVSRRPFCAAIRAASSCRSTRPLTKSTSRMSRSCNSLLDWLDSAVVERTVRCRCTRPTAVGV